MITITNTQGKNERIPIEVKTVAFWSAKYIRKDAFDPAIGEILGPASALSIDEKRTAQEGCWLNNSAHYADLTSKTTGGSSTKEAI